ncbi:MAG TPA: hypothetical protein VIV12_20600 [Streptosporangiaceae bacterium]
MPKEVGKFSQGRTAPHGEAYREPAGTPSRAKPAGAVPRAGGMAKFDEHQTAPNNDSNKAS